MPMVPGTVPSRRPVNESPAGSQAKRGVPEEWMDRRTEAGSQGGSTEAVSIGAGPGPRVGLKSQRELDRTAPGREYTPIRTSEEGRLSGIPNRHIIPGPLRSCQNPVEGTAPLLPCFCPLLLCSAPVQVEEIDLHDNTANDKPFYDTTDDKPSHDTTDDKPWTDNKPSQDITDDKPCTDNEPSHDTINDKLSIDNKPSHDTINDKLSIDNKPSHDTTDDKSSTEKKPSYDATLCPRC
ncbi:hypothetical protein FOZ63_004737, partial [Perkinsus olseni]